MTEGAAACIKHVHLIRNGWANVHLAATWPSWRFLTQMASPGPAMSFLLPTLLWRACRMSLGQRAVPATEAREIAVIAAVSMFVSGL